MEAAEDEHVYGCGEQMSYFDLRGRHFPLWSSEPGVGRDKTTYVTWRSDVENGGAGGDYYNTNYPQPTYVSSRHYYLHMDTTAYGDFDFRNPRYHELQCWNVPGFIRIEAAPTFVELLEKLTAFLGRQPELPEWIYNGLIIGAQGGNERSFGIVDKSLEHGIKVSGLWCQDWCGKRVTSFGKRLQWDWHFHKEMYPDLPKHIEELHARGIKFLGYVNPYLVNDGELYAEGKKRGVFAKKADGSDYLVDFGEFYCGVVDFTNPEAYNWFKDEVIKKYTLDIGIDGWMADFGEYLPTDDLVLANGVSPMIEHNHWPVLWAKCNYDAVKESGKLGQVVYFMRAGGTGSQQHLAPGEEHVHAVGLGGSLHALAEVAAGDGHAEHTVGGGTDLIGVQNPLGALQSGHEQGAALLHAELLLGGGHGGLHIASRPVGVGHVRVGGGGGLPHLVPGGGCLQGHGNKLRPGHVPGQLQAAAGIAVQDAQGGDHLGHLPWGGNGPRRKAGQGQGEGETAGQQAGQYASFHQFAAPFYVDVGAAMSRPN
mgnify:CR=1 FL=1